MQVRAKENDSRYPEADVDGVSRPERMWQVIGAERSAQKAWCAEVVVIEYIQGLSLVANPPAIGPIRGVPTSAL